MATIKVHPGTWLRLNARRKTPAISFDEVITQALDWSEKAYLQHDIDSEAIGK